MPYLLLGAFWFVAVVAVIGYLITPKELLSEQVSQPDQWAYSFTSPYLSRILMRHFARRSAPTIAIMGDSRTFVLRADHHFFGSDAGSVVNLGIANPSMYELTTLLVDAASGGKLKHVILIASFHSYQWGGAQWVSEMPSYGSTPFARYLSIVTNPNLMNDLVRFYSRGVEALQSAGGNKIEERFNFHEEIMVRTFYANSPSLVGVVARAAAEVMSFVELAHSLGVSVTFMVSPLSSEHLQLMAQYGMSEAAERFPEAVLKACQEMERCEKFELCDFSLAKSSSYHEGEGFVDLIHFNAKLGDEVLDLLGTTACVESE